MNLEELVAKDLAARSGFAVKEDAPEGETVEQPVEEEVKQESSLIEETTDTPPQEEKVETPEPEVIEPNLDDVRAQLR